ncbi:RNA polymerase II-associated protein 3-like isoform X2 [Cyclopterus lumpus]|uniref:RNA polymerase II-associated protein 3-like isoform X2 n=1 Tax=Cyclopterus lumpus TaxID=8103 RepID=UPI0014860A94|nr:RNA polymerase II-associated protein 3-like isoform X2 [Cyclopterus lumpus]
MPKKKDTVKGGAPLSRIRENSRLMRTHESMIDFINGRQSMEVIASGLLGFDFLRTVAGELEDDIIYSDDDYNDDDEDDHFYAHNAAYKPLEPHPQIKQLTDEEADKHAKERIEEEERRKDKTEKNKRKKLRKREKKRLDKENAVKDILPEEEKGESDSSEIQEENPVIESIAEANYSLEPGRTQSGTEAAGCDENNANNKEETPGEIITTKDGEQKDLDLNNSYASTTKLVAEEAFNERPARERKKKTKLLEVLPSREEKPKVVEEPEIQKKEEKHEPNKEEFMDPTTEELAKRSRELAGIGNRLAVSGQYEMAVKCFTDAIKYNPKEFKLFGNRSLCYERMQQYENALRDADLALSMEPNWIKGLFRKGKALCGLKRYYEASLIYKEVLMLESSSAEAVNELKRAQTLHLMEMGFTWAQSLEALKTHATLEQAVEALFGDERNPGPGDASASYDNTDQPVVQEENDDAGEWVVLQTNRPRMQQVKEFDALVQSRSNSQSPSPRSKNSVKPDIFSVWVGSLAPAVTYLTLHELFSRAGTVYSIKMLLEHQCAFVNYTRKEDCDRAIQCINGLVVEGAPLSVRFPSKFHTGLGMSRSVPSGPFTHLGLYNKECFFWRTTGCTRQDCTFRHVPEHKNLDEDKFTSRMGSINQ